MEQKNVTVSITRETVFFAVFVVVCAGLLFYLRNLVYIVLTAIVISSAIEPVARSLSRRRVPRVLSVLSIYVLGIVCIFGAFYFLAPPVLEETKTFLANLPAYAEAFGVSVDQFGKDNLLGEIGLWHVGELGVSESLGALELGLTQTAEKGVGVLATIFGGVVSLGLIIVLSFYFSIRETGIDDFLRVVVPMHKAEYAVRLWRRAQYKIGRWLQGQILLSLLVGALIAIGLSMLGVRHAILLGILAALLEIVPIFGSIFAAIPALAIAFIDGGASLFIVVCGLYVLVNQFESHVVYPLVVQKIVDVPPVLIIISLLAGAQLAGMYGIILSVPIAAILREYVADVQKGRQRAILSET